MKKFLIIVLAIFITGCASTRITPEDEKRIRNVAVITLVPDKANFEKIGLTVFNNERSEFDMGDQITSTIFSTAKKRITAARPKWTIKDISYDRPLLIERINKRSIVMSYAEERIEKELAELSRNNDLDAIFVVTAQQYDSIPGNGVGVWLRTMSLSSIGRAYVHSNIDVKVVGSNGTVIARGFGLPENPKVINPAAYDIKYEMNDNMNPNVLNRLRPEILEQLQRSINKRFDQLDLR